MKIFTGKNSFLLFFLLGLIFLFSSPVAVGQQISFEQTSLDFNGHGEVASGTSLEFGPDGRLYVAQLNGEVKIYEIVKTDRNSYQVETVETIFAVRDIPNHDDNGAPAYDNRNKRQSTGLTVVGTSSNPVIYMSSSDPKWGGPSGDKALDTNSGIITRLTWTGTEWEVMDLVRGLPRSEENHSTNAVKFVTIRDKPYLLVASGGFTNAGSPSQNFAYISEYALSAAILSVNLEAIEALPTQVDSVSARSYKYNLPTLDDPTRENVNGIYDPNHPDYDGVDVNDPFGGNDGLNMAMLVEGGPVQVFSPGYRNSYDLVVTTDNKVFVTDNGANTNWGGLPEHEGDPELVSNRYLEAEPGGNGSNPSESGEYVENKDHLLLLTDDLEAYQFGSFYGGHPTPTRANPGHPYPNGEPFPYDPGGAGLYTRSLGDNNNWTDLMPPFPPNEIFRTQILEPVAPGDEGFAEYASTSLPVNWPPVSQSMANPEEADYRAPTYFNPNGPQPEVVTVFKNNSNGIAEYTASNFGGALKGALIVGRNEGFLHLLTLHPDGSKDTLETDKWNLNGGNVLGVSANGDEGIFPGTIWVATFDNRIMVLTPVDDVFCISPEDPLFDPLADYDNDGYTNQDELDNGTDPCSGASVPNDYDGDFVSDLNDLDDDGDGIPDHLDPFQLGSPVDLPVNNELFSNQTDQDGRQHGYLGLGLTGLMNNGAPNPNWLNWLDVPDEGPAPNDIYGGTAGAIQIALTGGTANGSENTQEKGFQFGVNVGMETGDYVISSGLLSLAAPGSLYDFEGDGEIGVQIGDGMQSNFIKLVLTKTQVIAAFEENDIPDPSPLTLPISVDDRPKTTETVVLSFNVSPSAGTVEPVYKFGERPEVSLGLIEPTGVVLDAIRDLETPLAIGVFGSSFEAGKEFLGTWDYFRVTGEQPHSLKPLTDIERIIGDPDLTINLNEYFGAGMKGDSLAFSVEENSDPLVEAIIDESTLTLRFPDDAVNSNITVRASNSEGLFVEQTFAVNVVEGLVALLRINAGGEVIVATDGGPDWLANDTNGPYEGAGFEVNLGLSINTPVLPWPEHHSSIPDYIDSAVYEQIFSTERYNSNHSDMVYNIPLSEGDYTVNLFLGNSYSGTSQPGQRVFDVLLEGQVVLPTLDLAQKYGHLVGAMEQFEVTVADGELNIAFRKVVENPLINAIEIIGRPIQTPITITDPIADQINSVGDTLNSSLVVIATGGDGNLEYQAKGLPPVVSIEPTNGTLYGAIEEGAMGNSPYLVTITVDDSDQTSSDAVSFDFIWTITSPPAIGEQWTAKGGDEAYTGRHENAFVQAGDKFYLMGGREDSKAVDIYDYASESWTTLSESAPFEFNHFQAITYQGLIWVIGAFQDNAFPNEIPAEHVWIFDPVGEKWIEGPEIPEDRRRGGAGLVLFNDKFYVIGGNTQGHSGGYVDYFDEYDPHTGQWTVLENAPRARDHFHAVLIGSELFVASGRQSGGEGGVFAPVIQEVDVFDFSTNSWYTLPDSLDIPTPRAGAIAVNYQNKLLIAGGERADAVQALAVTEVFDPARQAWARWGDLNHPRHGTQGVLSGEGIYVVAGSPTSGGGNQKNMEYLGIDNPVGKAIIPSSLDVPEVLEVTGESADLTIRAQDGNQGVFIQSVAITGTDSAAFILDPENLRNLLVSQDSSLSLTVHYMDEKAAAHAILSIEYGGASIKEVELKASEETATFSLYLNAGDQADVVYKGQTFVGDMGFEDYYDNDETNAYVDDGLTPLFQSERNGNPLSYAIPVPNGVYTVHTYHNELWFGKDGPPGEASQRVFDILLEGIVVKDGLDFFVESDNAPLVLTFTGVLVTDGVLNLDMPASTHHASISGIAIVSESPTALEPIPEEMVISLYPNPADTETIISLDTGVRLDHILVHNMSGQLMYQLDPSEIKGYDGKYLIPLDKLSPGVYLISLVGDHDLIKQLRLVVNP